MTVQDHPTAQPIGEPLTPEQYEARWPNYCRHCQGWGGTIFYENHGLPGPGEQLFEPCHVCWDNEEQPNCARCRFPMSPDDAAHGEPCKACGWDGSDGLPEPDYDWEDPDGLS